PRLLAGRQRRRHLRLRRPLPRLHGRHPAQQAGRRHGPLRRRLPHGRRRRRHLQLLHLALRRQPRGQATRLTGRRRGRSPVLGVVMVRSCGRVVPVAGRRSRLVFLVVLVGALSVAALWPAGANPGDPRVGFGSDGIVRTDVAGRGDTARKIARLPDGRILLAGEVSLSGPLEPVRTGIGLVRLNDDGSRDPTFGNNGVAVATAGLTSRVTDLDVMPDGRFVVGSFDSTDHGVKLGFSRFLADGSADPSFGQGGLVLIGADGISGGDPDSPQLAVAPDGSILAVGAFFEPHLLLIRLRPDGSGDPSFGNAGVEDTGLPLEPDDGAVTDSEGRLLVGIDGVAPQGPTLYRYRPDGTLDRTFEDPTPNAFVPDLNRLAIAPDGSVYAFAAYLNGPYSSLTVYRWTADGAVDRSFGANGVVTLPDPPGGGQGEGAWTIQVQPDGRIVIDGLLDGGFFIGRLFPDGERDTTLGPDGVVASTVFAGSSQGATSGALALNADLLLTGPDFNEPEGVSDFLVARIQLTSGAQRPSKAPSPGTSGTRSGYWMLTSAGQVFA